MSSTPKLIDFNYRVSRKPKRVKDYGFLFTCNNPLDRCGLCYNDWNYAWEFEYIQTIRGLIEEHSIGIDVGAHTGTYGIGLKSKIERMYCFEPNIYAFEALQLNSGYYPSLIPFNYCCGDKYVTSNENVLTSVDNTIETISLDDFFGKDFEINFLKIDTDGYDVPILQGASNIVKNSKNLVLLIELDIKVLVAHNLDDKDFFSTLKDCGLDCSNTYEKIKPLLTDRFFTNIIVSKKGTEVSSSFQEYYQK